MYVGDVARLIRRWAPLRNNLQQVVYYSLQGGYVTLCGICLFVCQQDNSSMLTSCIFGGVGCMTSDKWLDVGDESDHDPDPGFLTEFLPLRVMGNCTNFVGSAASAEVCGLRVLVVLWAFDVKH